MKKILKISIIALVLIIVICTISNAAVLSTEEERAFYEENIILIKTVAIFINICQFISLAYVIVLSIIFATKKNILSQKKKTELNIAGFLHFAGMLFLIFLLRECTMEEGANSRRLTNTIVIITIYLIFIGITIYRSLKKEEKTTKK